MWCFGFVWDTDSSQDSSECLDHCSDSDLVLVHSARPLPQAPFLLSADIGLGECEILECAIFESTTPGHIGWLISSPFALVHLLFNSRFYVECRKHELKRKNSAG